MSQEHVPSTPVTLRGRPPHGREGALLEEPRRARGRARVPRVPEPRVPGAGLDVRGPEGPARVHDLDGRLARARGSHRLHQAAGRDDPALRAAAGAARAGAAALLRDRDRPRRLRARHPRGEPRGPPDQDRGQPRSPGEPRRHRRVRPGPRAGPLRPRPVEGRALPGPAADLGRLQGRAARAARQAAGQGRGRPALPDRPQHLADLRRPDAQPDRDLPGGEVDELGAGHPRQLARRRGARLRRAGRGAVPLRAGRRDPEPGGRLRRGPPREPAPRARVRGTPQARGRHARDEPRLRGRGLAHVERRFRRPPPGAQELRDRGIRAGGGRRAGRRRPGRRRAPLGRPGGEGPEARRGARARDRGRVAAARGARDRPRDQRGPGRRRQHRQLHGTRRDRGRRRGAVARGARRRDAPGCGRDARDPRLEPGLRGARRSRHRLGPRQGAVPDPPRARQRRDGRAQPLAPAGLAPARELGRPAGGRRDSVDRAAADRTALPHALRARGPGGLQRRASRRATRSCARTGRKRSGRPTSRSAGTGRSTTASSPAPPSRRRRCA